MQRGGDGVIECVGSLSLVTLCAKRLSILGLTLEQEQH